MQHTSRFIVAAGCALLGALGVSSFALAASSPATPTAAPAVAGALTWNDLVRRPETRPVSAKINREFRFQGGVVVRAGTEVNLLEFKPATLVVGTKDGRTNFDVKADDTDVLALANAAWAQLTPAQRALTYPALLQRTDLWPYRVKLQVPFELSGRKTRVGDTAILLKQEGQDLLVRLDGTDIAFNVQPSETDLMAQARTALTAERGIPGRLLEEFSGKLVSPSTGRTVVLDAAARPKYVVMYMGAGWCGPCQEFSPKLVAGLKKKGFKPEDVTLLYLSGDKTSAEAKTYTAKLGIDWPMLTFKNRGQLPAFAPLFGDVIPQLVVTDRHGKVLIDTAKSGFDGALAQLQKLP